jgi:transcription elongation factor GreB
MQSAKNNTAVSSYITPDGHKRLHDELSFLWKIKRPQVTQAVAEAAAMGDRSENADYIYGKRQLRQIDSRIRFLKKRLEKLVVVDRKPADQSKVYFSAWVELEDTDGNAYQYRIVGPDETDAEKNFISIDSPMAKALMHRSEGDEVTVSRPNGTMVFVVTSIRY